MRAMLIFAFFPLLVLLAQPFGHYSFWVPTILIGIGAAAHQSWSANIFSTVGDMFPKHAIATVTGIGGLAGGLGSFFINIYSGKLFDYAQTNWSTVNGENVLSRYPEIATLASKKAFFEQHGVANMEEFLTQLTAKGDTVANGFDQGYMIVFTFCALAYLVAWVIMKILVPKMKPVKL